MEMYNKSKLQFINVVVLAVGLFAVLFLSFVSISGFGISLSFKYSEMSDWDWLVDILFIAAIGANAYILYMMNMNKKNEKHSMMATLISALAGIVAVIFAVFDVLLKDLDEVSLDFGFWLFLAAGVIVAGLNGYNVFMNKDFAKKVMGDMKSDMKKGMDSQMAKSESMSSDKKMGSEDKA